MIAWHRKGCVTPWLAILSAELTWGSVPVKSRWIVSPSMVSATSMRIGTSERRSSSMYSVNRYVPSGIFRIAARARCSA